MSALEAPEAHDDLTGIASPSQATAIFGHDTQKQFLIDLYKSGRMHIGQSELPRCAG
jgi:hypothetical protein